MTVVCGGDSTPGAMAVAHFHLTEASGRAVADLLFDGVGAGGKRFHFQDCGPVQLKGVSEPTSLYCVSWRDG